MACRLLLERAANATIAAIDFSAPSKKVFFAMAMVSLRATDRDLPPVDERLAPGETRFEVLDGELVYVPPCFEPHGRQQLKIGATIEAHVMRDFTVACDMLTRTSKTDDFAPDVSVYPRARDPRTGGRQLEHLAFEIVDSERLKDAGRKAGKLIGRGVRRVFAIHVRSRKALEWSSSLAAWCKLDAGGTIEDPTLALPLRIADLVDAAAADGAMARALIAKKTPEIAAAVAEGERRGYLEGERRGYLEGEREGMKQGRLRGRAEAVIAMLDAREVVLSSAERARILGERDPAILDRWTRQAASCRDVLRLFAGL